MVTAELLEPLLRQHVDPAATCAEPVRAAAGNGQETWLVDAATPAGPLPLVLRRSAPDGTLGWTDRAAEFAVLEAVGAAGLPVPRVLWLDDAGGVLGRPYFVMERLPGRVPSRLEPDVRDALSRELGAWLARLHDLDLARPESPTHAVGDSGLVVPISVFAEVDGAGRVEAFVRDRGAGFDPGRVPADRRGVRESIVGRMERHRGRATIHSSPGQGTEVELVLESP